MEQEGQVFLVPFADMLVLRAETSHSLSQSFWMDGENKFSSHLQSLRQEWDLSDTSYNNFCTLNTMPGTHTQYTLVEWVNETDEYTSKRPTLSIPSLSPPASQSVKAVSRNALSSSHEGSGKQTGKPHCFTAKVVSGDCTRRWCYEYNVLLRNTIRKKEISAIQLHF
jgi:hypothetical protein